MENALESKFEKIKHWKLGNKTAVHKPLLILYVLSQYKKGHKRLFSFEYELYDQVKSLLERYNQNSRSQHPEYPFWRLQKDGFWEVNAQNIIEENVSGDVKKKDLFEGQAEGGFKAPFYEKLLENEYSFDFLSLSLLKRHFAEDFHESLINFFEINLSNIPAKKVSKDGQTQYNPEDLLEELLSEFES